MSFLVKWLINGVIVTMLLMYFADVDWLTAAITASVLTVIAYVVGDLMILRNANNAVATAMDFVLAALYLWLVAEWLDWPLSFGEIVTISVAVGIAEWIFHRYVIGEAAANRG